VGFARLNPSYGLGFACWRRILVVEIVKIRVLMALNIDKIDDAALALLYLTLHDGCRACKGMDWDVLGRLHDKGMIHDPVGKVKSVVFTEEGLMVPLSSPERGIAQRCVPG
jgi:hypothetical protein